MIFFSSTDTIEQLVQPNHPYFSLSKRFFFFESSFIAPPLHSSYLLFDARAFYPRKNSIRPTVRSDASCLWICTELRVRCNNARIPWGCSLAACSWPAPVFRRSRKTKQTLFSRTRFALVSDACYWRPRSTHCWRPTGRILYLVRQLLLEIIGTAFNRNWGLLSIGCQREKNYFCVASLQYILV